jgi:hypothetical protein
MKDKLFYFLSLCLILCFLFPTYLYAHPGGTDAYGGHYNHSTGEYHYHHGYSEHQHVNGVCPYYTVEEPEQNESNAVVGSARQVYTLEEWAEATREEREAEQRALEEEKRRKNEEALRILEERKRAEAKANEVEYEEKEGVSLTNILLIILAIPTVFKFISSIAKAILKFISK